MARITAEDHGMGSGAGLRPQFDPVALPPPGLREIATEDLRLRRILPHEVHLVEGLRTQIDLAAAMSVDPEFFEHEKKKTRWAWCSRSSSKARSSARSG